MRNIWFRSQTLTWYCTGENGEQINLRTADKNEALRRWHLLNAGKLAAGQITEETDTETVDTAVDLIRQFLEWCKAHRPASHAWYKLYCDSFAKYVGGLRVGDVKPLHITGWLDAKYAKASPSARNGAVRAVVRVFNWAVRQGIIKESPVRGVERPRAIPREVYLEPAQWERLLGAIDGPFKDIVLILHESGCRPFEARIMEARFYDRAINAWVFPREQSKGKRYARAVPLNKIATEITVRLCARHPSGPIFRNDRGVPWTSTALSHRFAAISKTLGFPVTPYTLRHTFITDALIRGVDPITLAQIVGHRSLSMISAVYAHVQLRQDHMQKAIRQATGEDNAT